MSLFMLWERNCATCICFFFSKAPLEETNSELRKELEQCLISNKAKREQVHKLEAELGTLKNQLKDQEIKAQRMEKIAQEHEVKFIHEWFLTSLEAFNNTS